MKTLHWSNEGIAFKRFSERMNEAMIDAILIQVCATPHATAVCRCSEGAACAAACLLSFTLFAAPF